MEHLSIYHKEIPGFILDALRAPEMLRLKEVGMDCGCEYTSFPRFHGLSPYSRFDHSVGAALIVWHFTEDIPQTLSALFHDISSPVFAHVVDFLYGDHLKQESTEAGTAEIISGSAPIGRLLDSFSLSPEDVNDYHRFPVADNDSPRLSADRLEYSCGNMIRYGFRSTDQVRSFYEDLFVGTNEEGAPELVFSHEETALSFAMAALQCSKIYVSDEDRYSMQALALILKDALSEGILCREDLNSTEPRVIEKITSEKQYQKKWDHFCSYRRTLRKPEPDENGLWLKIPAKKRYIDPFVDGRGRLSQISPLFNDELKTFLDASLDHWICGYIE